MNADSDRDGLSDALEQALLERFAPTLSIGADDCSHLPAAFKTETLRPEVTAENGTLYGQVSPAGDHHNVEIRYFHLWKTDCGLPGHPLDDEHVSALIHLVDPDDASSSKALYWYAAAHEDTVCDVSQIARASTLGAEDRGAHIWISPGKHASYLEPTLCHAGCGADRCEKMKVLPRGDIVNLGEPGLPMNGSAFIASTAWQLSAKMSATNFPAATIARVDGAPANSVLWFHAGRHPAQGVIAVSSTTQAAIATGENHAAAGIATGSQATNNALDSADASTGNALRKSYRNTKHALGVSIRNIGKALDSSPAKSKQSSQQPQ